MDQGFRQRGDGGISPPSNDSRGISPNLSFFGNFCSSFENVNNFKCNFKAFRSRILKAF
jgi:hypothetical protein